MKSQLIFQGFPQAALDFLARLAENNNREWFEAHKQTYQQAVVAHAPAFVAALGERLQTLASGLEYDTRTNGSGSLMRIYRDVRFSQDKTPYKTHVAFLFWEGGGKKMENPSFGFQFNASGGELYAGQFMLPDALLTAYRQAVVHESTGEELARMIADVQAAGVYGIGGEHYKRVPSGYPADHPRAALLRHNGLYAHGAVIDAATLTTPVLVDQCFEHFRRLAPIQQWLVRLGRGIAG
jgi:uncharacterized protein (TIGR02453 family)